MPALALGFWTFIVLIMIPIVRFHAVGQKQAKAKDFKLGESDNLPDYVRLPNRNYMNLLELPILFYFITIIIYMTGISNDLLITLAWVYFALRVVHSIVHIFYNNVLLRLAAFASSNVILLVIWVIVLNKILFHAG
jgi:hypothetical protein